MYIWYIVNPYHGWGMVPDFVATKPMRRHGVSECSMLIPTWEAFLSAS